MAGGSDGSAQGPPEPSVAAPACPPPQNTADLDSADEVVIKTLRVMKMDDHLDRLQPCFLPEAVYRALRDDAAAVDCMRLSQDGILYLQFFSHDAAKAVNEKYEDEKLPLKFDWSFVNLDLYLGYASPDKVIVVHVDEAERGTRALRVLWG